MRIFLTFSFNFMASKIIILKTLSYKTLWVYKKYFAFHHLYNHVQGHVFILSFSRNCGSSHFSELSVNVLVYIQA